MDDRVQQCPNCGSAVLPSARFCVTCGIRLPDSPGGSGDGDPKPSGWSQPAEDVWIGEAPALDDESEQRLADDFQSDQPSAIIDAGSAERGEWENGGSDGGTSEDAVIALPPADPGEPRETAFLDTSNSAEAPTGSDTAEPAPDQEEDDIAGSSASPQETAPPGDEPGPEPDERAVEPDVETGTEQVGPEGELTDLAAGAETMYAASDGDSPDGQMAQAEETGSDREDFSLEPDDFEPAGWGEEDDGADGLSRNEPPASVALAVQEAAGQESDLDRATALLEELRDLLPRLAAPATPPETAADLSALRERAIMARGDRSFDDFAALREVVSDAVNRPRDIEVVLRLSQRIDDIDALLNERDRLDAAFSDLVAGLEQ